MNFWLIFGGRNHLQNPRPGEIWYGGTMNRELVVNAVLENHNIVN